MVAALSRHRPRALMIAPAMPAETGNGLAMRLGVFLEALGRIADVDLAVLPVAGRVAGPSPLVEGLGIRAAVIGCDRPDTHFALLSRLEDPKARLEAFVRYGRPRLSARLTAPVLQELRAMAAGRNYALVHVGRAYLAPTAQSWIGPDTALRSTWMRTIARPATALHGSTPGVAVARRRHGPGQKLPPMTG